jgi:hypothetical protein
MGAPLRRHLAHRPPDLAKSPVVAHGRQPVGVTIERLTNDE